MGVVESALLRVRVRVRDRFRIRRLRLANVSRQQDEHARGVWCKGLAREHDVFSVLKKKERCGAMHTQALVEE
jgi:hypothetical protein